MLDIEELSEYTYLCLAKEKRKKKFKLANC